jgi:hypothetical protein
LTCQSIASVFGFAIIDENLPFTEA